MEIKLGASLQGRVKCQVVDSRTKQVIRDYGWQNNLILNQGLNQLLSGTCFPCQAFTHCAAGSGSTPTRDSGGVTTAVQNGTTVTLSGGSFTFTNTSTDAGKLIKWGSGAEALVVTVTSPTSVEVDRSQTVGSGTFTVYRTNQTGLTAELKRSNSYLVGQGYCGTTQNPNHVMTHRRTFDLPAESGSVTYREIGFSYSSTVTANLFSRILLDTPVVLAATNQLRVVYDLSVTYAPAVPQTATFPISGWPVAPSTSVDGIYYFINLQVGVLNYNGTIVAGTSEATGLEINSSTRCSLLATTEFPLYEQPATIPVGPSGIGQATNVFYANGKYVQVSVSSPTSSAYVSNSFTRVKTWVFPPALADSERTDWRVLMLGPQVTSQVSSYWYPVFAFVFDQDQAKDYTHRLSVSVRWTFSRVIS